MVLRVDGALKKKLTNCIRYHNSSPVTFNQGIAVKLSVRLLPNYSNIKFSSYIDTRTSMGFFMQNTQSIISEEDRQTFTTSTQPISTNEQIHNVKDYYDSIRSMSTASDDIGVSGPIINNQTDFDSEIISANVNPMSQPLLCSSQIAFLVILPNFP
ncbi:16561_t:CDS:1 [Acaulospora colombiana]|uniref:16561_t:CDS:1 n=1 Tax=Acaulospora colombiana TaxID=27376 RepID=A0ACA9LGH3_9GLOM|nr:16561_t:CDS:1 [Acaulospora colombiana]